MVIQTFMFCLQVDWTVELSLEFVSNLLSNGELKTKPIALTWGLEDSRDVIYAQMVARVLNFEWQHIPMSPENVLENIQTATNHLGLIHSPELLHNMNWLNKNINKSSIVLAGSFGDSIGRAEFGGLHLLQLKRPEPGDKFKLLKQDAETSVIPALANDIESLFERAPDSLPYMHFEHFMQGYRMRGGLCHALSIINRRASVYQMFTAPEVYKFIWSLHPSCRDDNIYVKLLENYNPELLRIPWARTNKALSGRTIGAVPGLRKNYHDYTKWSKHELRHELENLVDLDWYETIGIFNIKSIESLRGIVRNSDARVGRTNDIWLWLAGFRVLIDWMETLGKTIQVPAINLKDVFSDSINTDSKRKLTAVRTILGRNIWINEVARSIRNYSRSKGKSKLKKEFLALYPPLKITL